MKKNTLLLILLVVYYGTAQNAPIDFEVGGHGATWNWTVFGNAPNAPLEIIANPVPGGINTSATVAKFTKTEAFSNYPGLESQHGADLGSFAVTAANSSVKLMVYQVGSPSTIIVKLVNFGAAAHQATITNTVADAWVELEFDLSLWVTVPLPGGNPDQIVIHPEILDSSTGRITYIDNIRFVPKSCPTTTTWTAGAWDNGTPTIGINAIIDDNYTTDATNGSFSACSLTVNGTLRVDDGYFVEVENDVTVNGNLIVESKGSFVQNNAGGTFTILSGGSSSVNKVTAVKQNWYYYTYWSSPVSGETIADAFPNTDTDRRFWFNAANFLDTDADDIDDNGDDWTVAAGTDIMQSGVGYAATSGQLGIYPSTDIATFIGPFNTGNITTDISYDAINTLGSWNFIGNPYPSAIDFEAFQLANASVIGGVAYFWSQASPPDNANPGNEGQNFNQNDYALYSVGLGAGVAGGGPDTPTQYIPSGQGFFVEGNDNNTVTFTNAMRKADATSNSQFFKNPNSKKNNSNSVDNKLWVNLTSNNGAFNQILIGYVNGATNADDGSYYDARKIVSQSAHTVLYSTIENSNKKYVIQGKDINSINENEIIKIGFKTNINVSTTYTLSIPQLEGDFLNNNTIYLKDKLLNTLHSLSTSDYAFTSETGEFSNRFEIVFNQASLSTDEIALNSKSLKISELEDNNVQFTTADNLSIKTVDIYDLLGRQLYRFKGNNNVETYKLSNLNNSIFIAKVELSNGTIITKKSVKRQ
ncbi:hypothetical protein [Flaviramulus aquimarinus]